MTADVIRVFIGYDKAEAVSYAVLAHSVMRRSSRPVSITPVYLPNLADYYWRERDPKQSNEFSFSRFLVPYLCGYKGHAIWMDCDMLCRGDIAELWDKKSVFNSVAVVKHDYVPRNATKFLGNIQHAYEKKNWSSVMVFNCAHYDCRDLRPGYINTATGLELHQFKWTSEDRIGELPKEWNWLVGEYEPNPDAKLVHFTVGGPYFNEYHACDYADEWRNEYYKTTYCDQLPCVVTRASAR